MLETAIILSAAIDGLFQVLAWPAFPFMFMGVLVGMLLGLIPGLGGLVGFALLIPFVVGLDPVVGLALLLGMAAVTTQTDTIPAVLIGVPGTSAAMATALDGYPMAKKGEAGRALCASYFASIFGTIVAAALFIILLPFLRGLIFSFGQPEFFMLVMFGLLLAGSLAGNSLLRGIIMAAVGLLLAMVSSTTSIGEPRYAGDIIYLWEGIPVVPLVLGLFAIPEVIDLARRGSTIAEVAADTKVTGMRQGLTDNIKNWWLVVKASLLGALAGFIPGLGGQVAEWMAYGAAVASDPDPSSFGKGNVRGVIAPEAGTAAQKPGALVPTLAFGIPGNVSMVILLAVCPSMGLVPGPSMLNEQLSVTFSMIWTMVIANILAAILALMLQKWLIRLCFIRASIIVPLILGAMLIGATMENRSFGDVLVFFLAGLFGYLFKHFDWPRVPLIMGMIMGALAERYLFLSINLHGTKWLTDRPLVWVIAAVIFLSIGMPAIMRKRQGQRTKNGSEA